MLAAATAAAVVVVVGATISMGSVVAVTADVVGGGGPQRAKIRVAWAGSSRKDTDFPLLHLHMCLDCPYPAAEGSLGERDFEPLAVYSVAVPLYLGFWTLRAVRTSTYYYRNIIKLRPSGKLVVTTLTLTNS